MPTGFSGTLREAERMWKDAAARLPQAEAVIPRILSLPTMIDPPEGYVAAVAASIRKVQDNYGELL